MCLSESNVVVVTLTVRIIACLRIATLLPPLLATITLVFVFR